MNFNFTNQPEYDLHSALTKELIGLYGVLVKFLITEKINTDENVFGDWSHLKTDSESIYEMYMLPETTEDWGSSGYEMNMYGPNNFENVVLFCSRSDLGFLDDDMGQITGNLIIFPNNRIMEITSTDPVVPGINNLFTFNDVKSVYKLTCKPYAPKLINELEPDDISADDDSYDTLNDYFSELIDVNTDQNTEAEVTEQVSTVDISGEFDTLVDKPIVDNTEEDIFNGF